MTLDQETTVTAVQALKFLSKLVEDLDKVTNSQEYIGVFSLAHIHGFSYQGAMFDKELIENIRIFLQTHSEYLKATE